MNLRKSLVGLATAGVITMSLTGCTSDGIDGTYQCTDKKNNPATLFIDGNDFEITANNNKIIQSMKDKNKKDLKQGKAMFLAFGAKAEEVEKIDIKLSTKVEKSNETDFKLIISTTSNFNGKKILDEAKVSNKELFSVKKIDDDTIDLFKDNHAIHCKKQ